MESHSPFIVRYQASKSSGGMKQHKDNAHLSYIINLSDNNDFVGGGTHIFKLNRTFTYDQGQSLVFPSQVGAKASLVCVPVVHSEPPRVPVTHECAGAPCWRGRD